MKKFMKIWLLGFALIVAVFFLNKTNAQIAGQITFNISGAINTTCTYGTSWDLGAYSASMASFTASGNLTNFVCTDTQGLSDWAMTIFATTPVSNWSTSIPATGVSMQATANIVTVWTCTAGTNTTWMTSIGTTGWTIMAKASTLNQICTITTSWIILNVDVPGGASIGVYTWTLSLTLPW